MKGWRITKDNHCLRLLPSTDFLARPMDPKRERKLAVSVGVLVCLIVWPVSGNLLAGLYSGFLFVFLGLAGTIGMGGKR